MAHDVFISYSRKNKNTADAVCNALESSNIRCWIAPRDIMPGKEWGEAIVTAISEAKVMVLIFSAASNESQQVLREVERAVNKNVIIIPFRIEDVVPTKSMEYFLYSTHWLDALTPDLEKHIDVLTNTVVNLISSDNTTCEANRADNKASSVAGSISGGAAGSTASHTARSAVSGPSSSAASSPSSSTVNSSSSSAANSPSSSAANSSSSNAVSRAAVGASDIPSFAVPGIAENKTGQQRRKNRKPLLIAAGVLAVLLIAFGIYSFWIAPTKPVDSGHTADGFMTDGQQKDGYVDNKDIEGTDAVQADGTDEPAATYVSDTTDTQDASAETDNQSGNGDEGNGTEQAVNGENDVENGDQPSGGSASDQVASDKAADRNGGSDGSKGTGDTKAPAVEAPVPEGTQLNVGDYIRFGTYYGQPLVWRVINIDDEGCPLLLTDRLISFKCFDAAERENTSDEVRKIYGSNFWENSNIREWLNSADKSVKYSTSAPIVENVAYGENSSVNEPGFLAGFSADEVKLIKSHSHEVLLPEMEKELKEFGTEVYSATRRDKLNRVYENYDSSFGKSVKDKVFLLSIRELRDYVLERGWDLRAAPTAQAEARDESDYEELKHETDGYWSWWLSTPCATTPDCVYFVSYDGSLDQKNAFLANTCIRPAMYLSGSKLVLSGSGTVDDPYLR